MAETKRCDSYATYKEDGPEPYRCTLPYYHGGSCKLVQSTTGNARTLFNRPCSGGRIVFLTYQTT